MYLDLAEEQQVCKR